MISNKIRFAGKTEAGVLLRLINRAFDVERFFLDGDRIDIDKVNELFETGVFVVIEHEQEIAGCVYLEQQGERVYLGLLSIDPARQRSGLGSTLMDASEDFCRSHGCRFLDLRIVSLREELPGFYKRLGFVETGIGQFPENVPTRFPCYFINMSKEIGVKSQKVGT